MSDLILAWAIFLGGLWFVFRGLPYLIGLLLGSKGIVGDVANIILWIIRAVVIAAVILVVIGIITALRG